VSGKEIGGPWSNDDYYHYTGLLVEKQLERIQEELQFGFILSIHFDVNFILY